jgi:hypothetical protein
VRRGKEGLNFKERWVGIGGGEEKSVKMVVEDAHEVIGAE